MILPLATLLTLIAQTPPPIASLSEALVGKPAPPVSLELISGKKINLAEQQGKIVFLAFWATWCEPCRRDIPRLIEAQAEFKNLVVIGISAEPRADVAAYLRQENFDFPTALDPGEKVSKAYGIDLIPRLFVIDQKGIITKMIRGLPSQGAIRRALEPLLPSAAK